MDCRSRSNWRLSRTPTLSPRQLLERLGERLTLLTGGPHDLPARQQTLRDTLDWSAALLSSGERTMLARLSVFPNDASLEAATDVTGGDLTRSRASSPTAWCSGSRPPITRGSGCSRRFVNTHSSCSRTTDNASRTATLGISCSLSKRPIFAVLSRVVGWTSSTRSKTTSGQRSTMLTSSEDAETELRLVVALWRFWWLRGYLVEGRARLERGIARARRTSLRGFGPTPIAALPASPGARATWFAPASSPRSASRPPTERRWSYRLACHTVLGLIAKAEGDYERARSHLEQSGDMARALGREGDELVAKMNLGSVAFDAGDHAAAIPLWTDVLDYHRTNGSRRGRGSLSSTSALLPSGSAGSPTPEHASQRPKACSARLGFESISHTRSRVIAATEAAEGRDREAASLLGRAAALLEETGSGAGTFDASLAHEVEAEVRAGLGDREYASAFAPRAQHSGDQP